MKKFFAVVLSLLLLLPMFSCFAYADEAFPASQVEETQYPEENIAKDATITVEGDNGASKVNINALVDGDKATGSMSPFTRKFGYVMSFDETQYFTDLKFKVNGSGTIIYPAGDYEETIIDEFNIKTLIVSLTKNGKEVYNSGEIDVSQREEFALEDINVMADKIAIRMPSSDRSDTYYMYELEAYAKVGMPLCDVQLHNVAKDARFSYTTGRADDPETEANESQYGMWWAVNWLALVDGDVETGTHSPKTNSYYINMEFSQEYLISEFVFYCNGKGFLDDGSFIQIDEYSANISLVKICLYDLNGEKVYDSKDISVSGPTAKIDPYVNASRIEIQMFNGQFSGNEYMWEMEANIETGNHIFELTDTKNPTCDAAGYKELSCHCGKVIKQTVPATGFHQWDEGVTVIDPTTTENGVCEKTCELCGTVGEFDIPATGHTWDAGKVIEPTCTEDGYTIYTCTCDDCATKATYTTDHKQALGHDWDEGVVTKPSKLNEQGEKIVSCLRDGCTAQKVSTTRALTYFDNTDVLSFNSTTVQSATIDFSKAVSSGDGYYDPNNVANPPPTDDMIWNMFDENPMTVFYSPTGSVVEIVLNKTYYITSFSMNTSGNYCKITIELENANGDNVVAFTSPAINNGNDRDNLQIVDMAKVIGNGIETRVIRIKFDWAKWPNGNALNLHDMYATAHACSVTEDDYVGEGNSAYKAPTCTQDGSTVAICPVCGDKTAVILESTKYGHNVPTENVVADKPATCSEDGYGHGTCVDCGETVNDIKIKALGEHEYTKEIEYMKAMCGFLGVKQMVCEGCGRVGSQSPIPATGIHNYDWVEYSPTTFTAPGRRAWECTVCETHDPEKPEEERIEIVPMKAPTEELVTYVDKTVANGQIVLHLVLNLEYFDVVDYECDIRVITTMVDPDGNVQTYESYGKYSKNEYDPETGDVDAILVPSGVEGDYQISTAVRLMNFRGVTFVDVDLDPTTPEVDKVITFKID
ncbi:MAG: hypothetical protein IJW54_07170 [Clostridia bacterium]|nr:hypothetical protein [Clostridia bacterium]